jgi:hypothetical protein
MSDPGAVERNNLYAQIALDRARLRNLNNGVIPSYAPDSVVSTDMPSAAVDNPRNSVGGNNGE